MVFSTQWAMINGHKFRPNFTYAIPIIKPIIPTVIDLADKSYECLKPKIAACNSTAITVAKEVLENNRSNQLIKKPLSNNSSNNDSNQIKGMINKKCDKLPLRSPNLEPALSDEVSGAIENGKLSLTISKTIMEMTTVTRIPAEIPNVFPMFSGLRKPNSFQVTPLTLILQVATTKVVNDQKSPFAINPTLGIYISLTKNITAM